MHEQVQQIAARIRELRLICGTGDAELASILQIPLETYATYESGRSDIPVGILHRIAQHFNVELSSLITGEEPRLHTYCLTRSGTGPEVARRQAYRYQSLAANFIHKKAEPFLVTVQPSSDESPIPMNSHPGQEFNLVMEGSLQVVLGRHVLTLEAGDSLYFDSGEPHGMKALNGRPATFLAVIL